MLRLAVLLLWRNDCVDAFVFEKLIVLAVGVTRIGSESFDLLASVVFNAFYLSGSQAARQRLYARRFVLLAGGL